MKRTPEEATRIIINQLKEERIKRNLSHEKLAELCGLSRQAIGKIEAHERSPTITSVYKIICAMDIDMKDFIKTIDI